MHARRAAPAQAKPLQPYTCNAGGGGHGRGGRALKPLASFIFLSKSDALLVGEVGGDVGGLVDVGLIGLME